MTTDEHAPFEPRRETTLHSKTGDRPLDPPCTACRRAYCRTAGGIQWCFAIVFGWSAVVLLSDVYQPAFHGKGIDDPAHLNLDCLFFGTVCALLTLTGFIGGFGLLGLRRWVRRWEVAYLAVFAVGFTAITVVTSFDYRYGPAYITSLVLFSLAFSLPFVPFLFSGVDSRRLRGPAGKKPVSVYSGVMDWALDG